MNRNDIAGWCDSPGALATWNIFRRGFADEGDHAPDTILDHSRCEAGGEGGETVSGSSIATEGDTLVVCLIAG